MTKEEKLKRMYTGFSSLSEEKQDYILGIVQALVFAKNTETNAPCEDAAAPQNPATEHF